jgi:hypothetical protein
MAPYLTKKALSERYCVVPRTIERWWKDGRLPPPKFPTGPKKPYGDLEEIEALERAAIANGKPTPKAA